MIRPKAKEEESSIFSSRPSKQVLSDGKWEIILPVHIFSSNKFLRNFLYD